MSSRKHKTRAYRRQQAEKAADKRLIKALQRDPSTQQFSVEHSIRSQIAQIFGDHMLDKIDQPSAASMFFSTAINVTTAQQVAEDFEDVVLSDVSGVVDAVVYYDPEHDWCCPNCHEIDCECEEGT